MAAKSRETDPDVYQRLQSAYQEQCGRSPSALIDKLNNTFDEELAAIRSRPRASSKRDLISDKTLRNFFNAETPQSLTEKNLNYLCRALLGLGSYKEAIAAVHPVSTSDHPEWLTPYLDHLEAEHNTVRIPNMTQPAALKAVYTTPQFSEELQFRKNKSIAVLHAEMEPGYQPKQGRVEVFEVFEESTRLMIWGAAGSGKTTILKRYLLKIIEGLRATQDSTKSAHKIPIFIPLRQFISSEQSLKLEDYVVKALKYGALEKEEKQQYALSMLDEGKFIVMMDGLDEVPKALMSQIQNEVSQLVKNYPINRFLLTCRYGATDFVPHKFKEVEMTAFANEQIEKFVKRWLERNNKQDLAPQFLQNLDANSQIRELAKNPLMLTLLCTIYEQGYAFPKSASSLLEDATDLYLRKWDSYRRIEHRDAIYDGKLSRNRRRNLFCQLAFNGMAALRGPKYIWNRNELEIFIKEFIHNLPGVKENSIDTDTRAIINALESQDSLLMRLSTNAYTFSYRSFQEYFTAMSLLEESGLEIQKLKTLIEAHILKEDWRQALLFVAERIPSVDGFLTYVFKRSIQELLTGRLKEAFSWFEQATDKANVSSSSWRACYLTFDLKTDLYISRKVTNVDEKAAQRIASKLRQINKKEEQIKDRTPQAKLTLDLAFIHALVKDRGEQVNTNVAMMSMFDDTYRNAQKEIVPKFKDAVALAHETLPKFGQKLEELVADLPTETTSYEDYNDWGDRLREICLIEGNFDASDPIELTPDEVKALNNYLYLTEFLIDCLLADIYFSKGLRKEMIASLMLSPESEKLSPDLQLPVPVLKEAHTQ